MFSIQMSLRSPVLRGCKLFDINKAALFSVIFFGVFDLIIMKNSIVNQPHYSLKIFLLFTYICD